MVSPTITPPGYQERVLFLGANGSGKTILASRMLAEYPRAVVLDLKGDFPDPWRDTRKIRELPTTPWGAWRWSAPHIIYYPRPQYRTGAALSAFLGMMWRRAEKEGKRRPFVLYVDEGLALDSMGAGTWIGMLAVSGRSLNLGLWVSSQRPRNIPVEVRSEAWRWYIFYLSYRQDEKEVVEYAKGQLTVEDLEAEREAFGFWELRRTSAGGGRVAATRYPPLDMS